MAAFESVQARPRPLAAQVAGHRVQGSVEPRTQPRIAAERQKERGDEQHEGARQAPQDDSQRGAPAATADPAIGGGVAAAYHG